MMNDEIPAVAGGAQTFAEDALETETFEHLSTDACLDHSNWKARKDGLERICKEAQAGDAASKDLFLARLPKLAKENNTAVQEVLFETANAFLDRALLRDQEIKELCGQLLKLVVERGITGRPKAAQVSATLMSSLTSNALHEDVANALIAGFSHKTPKNRQLCLAACATIVREFGLTYLPAKSILKAVSPLFNDANALVRKEAQNVFCQCYRYLGAGIRAFLGDLREVQAQEMMKTFEELQVGQVPEKTIKGLEPPKASKSVAAFATANLSDDVELDDDTYALLDEVAVVSKLPKNFFLVTMDKALKWQERCKMVRDSLTPLIQGTKRLRAQDDYHELTKCLKELFLDPQAPLMLIAIASIQSLCKGLRQNMSAYIRPLIGPVFEKMKDKKTSVLEHMYLTLNTMLKSKCVTMDVLHDEMEAVAVSKVPNQRLALIQWISGVLDFVDKQHCQRLQRATAMLLRLCGDEKLEVRDASLQLVAKLTSIYGDRVMQNVLSGLDAKQLTKVLGSSGEHSMLASGGSTNSLLQNCGDSPSGVSPLKKVARVEKAGPTGLVKALSASSLATAQRKQQQPVVSGNPMHRAATSAILSDGKRSTATTPGSNIPTPSSNSAAVEGDPVALEAALPSKDDSLVKLQTLLSEDDYCITNLSAKEWKVRCDALQRLATVVQDTWSAEQCTAMLEHLLVVLKSEPVWKDSIFQVVNVLLSLITECVKKATHISQRAAYVIIHGFTARLTEMKCKQLTKELLAVVAEGVTPKFVMKHVITIVQNSKNPKLTQEANEWFVVFLQEFGSTPIDAKNLVDYIKQFCFEQTQPQVKQSAIQLLVVLRQRVGPKLDAYLADINPHIKGTLDAELVKLSSPQTSPVTSEKVVRQLKSSAMPPLAASSRSNGIVSSGSGAAEDSVKSSATAHEDFPRIDVGSQLTSCSRDMVNAVDWKVRLGAIKKIEDILTGAHKNIAAAGVNDALRALRTRFDESNKNMVVDALRIMVLLLESAEGSACRPALKAVLPAVFSLLGDQKLNLRDEASKVCFIGARAVGMENLIPMLPKPLSSDTLSSRQITIDLLDKTLQHEAQQQSSSPTSGSNEAAPALGKLQTYPRALWIPLIPTLLKLAMDRAGDIRSTADRIIGVIMPLVGTEVFQKSLMDLRPAEQQQVRPMIERRVNQLLPPPPAPSVLSLQPHHSQIGFGVAHHTNQQSGDILEGSSTGAAPVPTLPLSRRVDPVHPLAGLATSSASARGQTARGGSSAEVEVPLTPNEIILGLRSASSSTAFRMCTDFMKRFRKGEDCGSTDMMQAMVDRLQENAIQLDTDLALGLINCLSSMFGSPRAALRCDTATLVPLFRAVFECLLSEPFAQSDTVIRSLNSMTLKMLEGCRVDEVFGALMSLMGDYSAKYLESNSRIDHKYVQVVVKCLMRLETEQVAPDVIIVSCHDYLLQHPPSAFKSRDDLSIRTIKTILQTVSRKHGRDLLLAADRLVGPQNLVSHFIRACLESKEKAMRMRMEAEQAAASEQQQQHQAATRDPQVAAHVPPTMHAPPPGLHITSTSSSSTNPILAESASRGASVTVVPVGAPAPAPAPAIVVAATNPSPQEPSSSPPYAAALPVPASLRAVEESKPVVLIFSKIRNHQTSNQGVEELYQYLKSNQSCPEFIVQYNKCSDAFRSYIKRRLVKISEEDTSRPEDFQFPDVVRHTD